MPLAKSASAPTEHRADEDQKSLKVMYLKTNLHESEHDLLIEHVDGNYYTIPNLPKITLSQKIKIIREELELERAVRKRLKPTKLETPRTFVDGKGDECREMTATDRFKANIEAMKRIGRDMERLKRIYTSVMTKLNSLS